MRNLVLRFSHLTNNLVEFEAQTPESKLCCFPRFCCPRSVNSGSKSAQSACRLSSHTRLPDVQGCFGKGEPGLRKITITVKEVIDGPRTTSSYRWRGSENCRFASVTVSVWFCCLQSALLRQMLWGRKEQHADAVPLKPRDGNTIPFATNVTGNARQQRTSR